MKDINWGKYIIIAIVFIIINSIHDAGAKEYIHSNYDIEIIDSCEYIVYNRTLMSGHIFGLTHKANCKFCIERNKTK